MSNEMTPEVKQSKINDLLSTLAATTDQKAKKKIRRGLRALGHRGGLRVVTNTAIDLANEVVDEVADDAIVVDEEVIEVAETTETKPKWHKRAKK